MRRARGFRLTGLGIVAGMATTLATTGAASATTATQTIASSGPLSGIVVGDDLDCQVRHSGWPGGAFYPTDSLTANPATGDCGTFLALGASVYGPDFSGDYASGTGISLTTSDNFTAYTPGPQSPVTGAGTTANPYSVTSSATAGTSGVTVSENDRYVSGDDGYTTAVTVTNTTSAPVSGLLYHAFDCFVQGTDNGYGLLESGSAVACVGTPGATAGAAAEELAPLTPGGHAVEGYFNNLWGAIDAGTDLSGSCDCTTNEDNAAGINWDFTLAPGASTRFTLRTNFTVTGGAPGGGSGPGAGSGGAGSQGGQGGGGRESSHHPVRITLRQLARHHRAAASLRLPAGTVGERVRARLHGAGVASATGTIRYALYRGRSCAASHRVLRGARRAIRHGRVPASARITVALRPGRYSWQALYSGDRALPRARSACGAATLTITR